MADKVVSIKASVPARMLGVYDTDSKDARRQGADYAQRQFRTAVESAASEAGVTVRDFETRYTRKGNVKASFVASGVPSYASDSQVQSRVIGALNDLSRRAGASNFDVQVADLDA